MNQGTDRIPCPRCRANNFLGQPTCWQCGGSLPPPEALGAATVSPAYSPYLQPKRSSLGIWIPLACILLLVAAVAGVWAVSKQKRTPAQSAELNMVKQMEENLRRQT